ncbi:Sperm-associated antigen 16 protein [Lamellibrachia satsuma]|nr:Sperm-associated antigen 16 protein [Lamellibrachia satsuma]
MATETENEKYYLEREQIPADEDSEYQYDTVTIEDDFISEDIEESLDSVVRSIRKSTEDAAASIKRESPLKANVTTRPEVVDDFVRNFLVKMGMSKSLDTFQTEWYEMQQRGLLPEEQVGIVPDIYTKNYQMAHELKNIRREMNKYKEAALKAKEAYMKLRKDRDYHRMHHKRVVQEKERLIAELKKLKDHYADYEPTLQQLKQRYETAMKEKMLTRLERDRAVGQVHGLKSTLRNLDKNGGQFYVPEMPLHACHTGSTVPVDKFGRGPTQRRMAKAREIWEGKDMSEEEGARYPNDSIFPIDAGVNPFLSQSRLPSGHLTRTGGFHLAFTYQAHSHAVSSVALHPRKQILSSTSDDCTWKMWAVPSGEIIMTGEGHTDWVCDSDFHPSGTKLATTSGDTTVKIWDFAKAECVHTFTEHTLAVWACSWHSCGDFLATCSMDNTAKIWDLNSQRCRFTLRGHTDSVNAVNFIPYSNTVITCSADKTVSLWDVRTGQCGQTFYGHMHSVNDVTLNLRCDTVASCDSYGVVKLWDMRTGAPMVSTDCGPHPSNKVAFDPSGTVLAIASNDSTIRMYEIGSGQVTSLAGHEDAVQCLVFDKSGDFLVSGGSDLTIRIWS